MFCIVTIITLAVLCALLCFTCLWVGAVYDESNERQKEALLRKNQTKKSKKDVSVENHVPK